MSTIDERRERASAGVALNHDPDGWYGDFARPRVYLQPIAAPSVLGLFGFAGATFIVAANMAGWYGNASTPGYLFPFAAFFGGLAQFPAGMWAYSGSSSKRTFSHERVRVGRDRPARPVLPAARRDDGRRPVDGLVALECAGELLVLALAVFFALAYIAGVLFMPTTFDLHCVGAAATVPAFLVLAAVLCRTCPAAGCRRSPRSG